MTIAIIIIIIIINLRMMNYSVSDIGKRGERKSDRVLLSGVEG